MTREEHTKLIRDIQKQLGDKDDGTITTMLADLSDDYGTMLSQIDTINLENTKYKADNENLRDTNMRLFLRVGEAQKKPSDEGKIEEEQPTIKIEDLFNEKGELK